MQKRETVGKVGDGKNNNRAGIMRTSNATEYVFFTIQRFPLRKMQSSYDVYSIFLNQV